METQNSKKHKTPIQNLYSLYDNASQLYWAPFAAENDDVAKRSLRMMAVDERSIISKAPNDYSLYLVGDFDPDDGQLSPLSKPLKISTVSELIS